MPDLYVHRVSYGKKTTRPEDREYRWGDSPVGNKEDWMKFAKEAGYEGVWFVEDDKVAVKYEVI